MGQLLKHERTLDDRRLTMLLPSIVHRPSPELEMNFRPSDVELRVEG